AKLYGVKAVIYVPRFYEDSRITEMRKYGAIVIPVDGKYEDAVELSMKSARENYWYDANPGGPNDQTSLASYSRIAHEIAVELGDAPYAISIPVGNGTTLVGVYTGFLQLYKEGYTTRMPRIVAATTARANQLAVSWAKGSLEPVGLLESEVRETWINEPLAAIKSLNAREALKALHYSKGEVYTFEDEELLEAALALKAVEGIDALPASAASILALRLFASLNSVEGPLVALVTGRWRGKR
ncbi:MAG: pyridoxal-phosphate dependent enzyme, partial [Thermofilaceae archaeon]